MVIRNRILMMSYKWGRDLFMSTRSFNTYLSLLLTMQWEWISQQVFHKTLHSSSISHLSLFDKYTSRKTFNNDTVYSVDQVWWIFFMVGFSVVGFLQIWFAPLLSLFQLCYTMSILLLLPQIQMAADVQLATLCCLTLFRSLHNAVLELRGSPKCPHWHSSQQAETGVARVGNFSKNFLVQEMPTRQRGDCILCCEDSRA